MRTDRTARSRPCEHRRRSCPARRLGYEMLEGRLLLAQTTGLFLNDPGTSDGYVLFSPNTSTTTYLMDKTGNVVNTWTAGFEAGLLGYLLEDGSLIRASSPDGQDGNGFIEAAGAGGRLEQFDWDGNLIWTFDYNTTNVLAHHDFEVLPNGNVLLIAWELKSQTEATTAGRDPGLDGLGYLYPDHIVEVVPNPGVVGSPGVGGTIAWEWHAWDHLVQEFDPTKDNYLGATGVDDHPELIDLNYVSDPLDGGGQREDWMHSNGIDYNADLDQIILSVRECSEFWVIDHSTTTAEAAGHTGGDSGKGGDLLYRWGNPAAYDTAGTRMLFFQHDAKWIEDGVPGAGNITVFNNGFGRPGTDFTSTEEIVPPVDGNGNYSLTPGQAYGPATPTWSYTAALDDYMAIISGTQRLPNGNQFNTYGMDGSFAEVTSGGTEVWRYVNPYTGLGTLGPEDTIPPLGALGLLTNFTFRAIHYPYDYAPQLTSTPVSRHIFYNNSFFDGDNAAINASDDAAIDTSKSAYLPGAGSGSFANSTPYTKGINGIMVDLLGGGTHTSITAADFVFKVGNNNTPGSWAAAPAPTAVSVRTGAGALGSDRVEITWADGAITNTWLEVQVLANANTGLADIGSGIGDVFFFGNTVADSNNLIADLADVFPVFLVAHPALPAVTYIYDYTKRGAVDLGDAFPVFLGGGSSGITALTVSSGGPFAPGGGEVSPATAGGGDGGISSGLAAMSIRNDRKVLPVRVSETSEPVRLRAAAVASFAQLLDPAGDHDDDETSTAADLDEELLDVLVDSLAE